MGIDAIASALVGAQLGRVQMAVAAKMMKMNMQSSADMAQLLEAAQQNVARLANVASGVGTNLDLSI